LTDMKMSPYLIQQHAIKPHGTSIFNLGTG